MYVQVSRRDKPEDLTRNLLAEDGVYCFCVLHCLLGSIAACLGHAPYEVHYPWDKVQIHTHRPVYKELQVVEIK